MFGTYHIIVLSISIIAIVLATIFLRKVPLKVWYKILLFVGIISETLKVLTYIVVNEEKLGGYLPKTDLPFHLCSLQLIFIAVLNLSTNEKLKRLIQCFMVPTCLIGGAAALFIPTSSSLNMPIITVQYFLFHSCISAFAIQLLMRKEFAWTVKDYVNCLKVLAVFGLFAIYLNSWIYDGESNINFMYVVNPPVSGLPLLNKNHGWLVYFVHYAFVAVLVCTFCYISPIIQAIKEKIHK